MSVSSKAHSLGFTTLLALGINGVVGVGIFFIPASVAGHVPGPLGAAIYALTALVCLPIALAFARLGSVFREDGGPYVFARQALGPRIAFGVGWLAFVSALASTAAVVRGFAQAMTTTSGSAGPVQASTRLVAALTVVGLTALVFLGLRISAWAWTTITVAKLLPLFVLIALWVFGPSLQTSNAPVQDGSISFHAVLRAVLIALFSLQGFEIVPVPAGHAKSAAAIFKATVLSLLVASALYVGLHMACVSALPNLSRSGQPIVDAARAFGGSSMANLVGAGTNISALGIALGMVAMTPRYLAALGRKEGLGAWVGATTAREVPGRALWITCVVVLGLVQLGTLEELFALSSVAVLAQYTTAALSLVVLGFRRQLGLGPRDAVLGMLAALAALTVVSGASWTEVGRAVAVVVGGLVLKVGVEKVAAHALVGRTRKERNP